MVSLQGAMPLRCGENFQCVSSCFFAFSYYLVQNACFKHMDIARFRPCWSLFLSDWRRKLNDILVSQHRLFPAYLGLLVPFFQGFPIYVVIFFA